MDHVIDKKQTPAQQTLLMARTVRNNLFHGGKHVPEGEKEKLVPCSLMVLKHCVTLDQNVRQRYEDLKAADRVQVQDTYPALTISPLRDTAEHRKCVLCDPLDLLEDFQVGIPIDLFRIA